MAYRNESDINYHCYEGESNTNKNSFIKSRDGYIILWFQKQCRDFVFPVFSKLWRYTMERYTIEERAEIVKVHFKNWFLFIKIEFNFLFQHWKFESKKMKVDGGFGAVCVKRKWIV